MKLKVKKSFKMLQKKVNSGVRFKKMSTYFVVKKMFLSLRRKKSFVDHSVQFALDKIQFLPTLILVLQKWMIHKGGLGKVEKWF